MLCVVIQVGRLPCLQCPSLAKGQVFNNKKSKSTGSKNYEACFSNQSKTCGHICSFGFFGGSWWFAWLAGRNVASWGMPLVVLSLPLCCLFSYSLSAQGQGQATHTYIKVGFCSLTKSGLVVLFSVGGWAQGAWGLGECVVVIRRPAFSPSLNNQTARTHAKPFKAIFRLTWRVGRV